MKVSSNSFYGCISNYCTIVCWKKLHFHASEWSWHPCRNLVDHKFIDIFQESQFSSTCLSLCLCHILLITVALQLGLEFKHEPSNFFFFLKILLVIQDPWKFNMHLQSSISTLRQLQFFFKELNPVPCACLANALLLSYIYSPSNCNFDRDCIEISLENMAILIILSSYPWTYNVFHLFRFPLMS